MIPCLEEPVYCGGASNDCQSFAIQRREEPAARSRGEKGEKRRGRRKKKASLKGVKERHCIYTWLHCYFLISKKSLTELAKVLIVTLTGTIEAGTELGSTDLPVLESRLRLRHRWRATHLAVRARSSDSRSALASPWINSSLRASSLLLYSFRMKSSLRASSRLISDRLIVRSSFFNAVAAKTSSLLVSLTVAYCTLPSEVASASER
jgi:hypothetical protein